MMPPPPRVMRTPLVVMTCAAALLLAGGAAGGSCPRPCVCFAADNGQPVANCTGLPDAAAAEEWPQTVLRVRFERASSQAAVMLKNRAFDRFPRLTCLDVEGGPIRYVDKAAFDGLPELVELNLVAAGVRKLHRYAVAGHGRLAFLSLKANPGLAVGPSFVVSGSITELDVSECRLKSLKRVYFAGLPNLKYLFAAGNELKTLGPQFGPPALKYADLARNRIETVHDDLDAYKRLRTLDVTGNPLNCTCELADVDRRLTSRGVAFGDTVTCANTGKPLGHTAEACANGGDDDTTMWMMMGDEPAADMYAQDHLIKIDAAAMKEAAAASDETDGSGSGSGDGGFVVVDDFGWKSSTPRLDGIVTETPNGDVPDSEGGQTTYNETVAGTPSPSESPVERTSAPNVDHIVAEDVPVTTALPAAVAASTTTVAPPTTAEPPTIAPPTIAPPTIAPPTIAPSTSAPPTTTPPTTTPPTTAPPTAAPPTEQLIVAVRAPPSAQAAIDGGNSSVARSASGGAIVSQTIQAPEDERDVRTKVADYLVSNVGVTGTAVLLAVVIVAIVYKAVCAGRRSRSDAGPDGGGKTVELKEIKYTAANTEAAAAEEQQQKRQRPKTEGGDDDDDDDDSPADSAEENALLDERLSDYDEDGVCDDDDDDESRSAAATGNGLLSSVMDAVVKNNGRVPSATPSNAAAVANGGSPTVPTRVIVKLTETPKASKPITVDNVH